MADPVSITASIIAVLQISGTIIQTSYQYLHSIRDSRSDIRRIINELNDLNSVLLSLFDLARSASTTVDIRLLNLDQLLKSSEGPLQRCLTELQILHSRLSQSATGMKGLGKNLLWPLKEKETEKTLAMIRAHKGTCQLALNIDNTALSLVIRDDVRALSQSFTTTRIDDRNKRVMDWYSAVDPYSNHSAACEKREPTTGDWFLNCAEFAAWLISQKSFLWLHGIPGCGKTVLSSTIIEKVLNDYGAKPRTAVAYFYFDFAENKKQSIKSCLSSLIAQICRQRMFIPEDVLSLYNRHNLTAVTTVQPLIGDFLRVLSAAAEGLEVFLICDALDECAERDPLMDALSTIASGNCGNIKILATSRSERDIEMAIAPLCKNSVRIQDEKIESDIRKFVVNSIAKGQKMRTWPVPVKKEVEFALLQGAKGMFRWVKCQLDVLCNRTTVRDVKKALNTLPPTLDETYERILLNIDRNEWEKARTALQWLIFSARPLRLEEIAEAVVIDPGSDSFSPEDRLFEPHDIVSICRSLVSLSDDTLELRLAHYSVQEYLISERIRCGPASFFSIIDVSAEVLIAEVCLTYILLFDEPDSLSETSLSEWPLLDYACRHWFHHVRKLADEPNRFNANQMAEKLFTPYRSFCFFNWLRVYEPDKSWIEFSPHKSPDCFATPLYYSACCGLLEVAKTLIGNGADVVVRGGQHVTPLNAAVIADSPEVASILIRSKAEVNVMDNIGKNALHHASGRANTEVVRLLLQSGAEIETQDSAGGNAMHIACFDGHIPTVRVLLEYGAEIDARAQFTLDNLEIGSDLEARWNVRRTPLMEAAWNGQSEVVQLLLDLGADINAVDDHGMTPLIRAARCGHENVVKLLLHCGANAAVQDKRGWTAHDWLSTK